jgi:phage-related protein
MPMAGYAGVDVFTNFNMCVTKGFHDYAGVAMDGMNSQMSSVTDSLGSIGDAMSDMRGLFSSVRGGFGMVFQMVFGKIANLMSSMQYLMIRIRTLMGRIVATFAAMIYAASGAMQTGEAVWNGPIGRVARL